MNCRYMNTIPQLALLLLLASTVLCGSNSGVFLNREAFLEQNIDHTTTVLESQMKKVCADDGINISFRRESIIGLGVVVSSQLQLNDPQCISTANQTHFTLHTGFLECDNGLKLSHNNTLATIENTVIIFPPTMFLTDDEDELGAEGEKSSPVKIAITCTYNDKDSQDSTPVPSPIAVTASAEIARATIELYNTDSYISEVDLQQDITRGTSIYAKVRAYSTINQESNFFIDTCYWSSEEDAGITHDMHYLIRDGCPTDRDVQFKEDTTNSPRKFLFRARRLYGTRPMYLHCSLATCYNTAGNQCTTQRDYCNREVKEGPQVIFHTSVDEGMTVVKRKTPILKQVISTSQAAKDVRSQPISTTAKSEQPTECPPTKPHPPCRCPTTERAIVNPSSPLTGRVPIEITVVISIITFFIGAAFIAICWCINVKTDSRRKMQAVSMSDDGLSSQESTVPTVKLMKHSNDITSSDESH